ncbi:MAG: hypothetical protein HYS38_09480 [Acidobacteria bacterium]|nr:hypothetical protein [Acidobacteriota bacterium]
MTDLPFKGVIFTPDDEPYLGRDSVLHFDQIISDTLEENRRVAPLTRRVQLSDLQAAATQLIPQGIHIALSIRELVRQGYLFGAAVLVRSLMERAAIISYLHQTPTAIELWKGGWESGKRPSLAAMIETISNRKVDLQKAKELCGTFNHLVHGDPMGSDFNLVNLGEAGVGYIPSKALYSPQLCDFVCFAAQLWLIVLLGMMHACFPDERPPM